MKHRKQQTQRERTICWLEIGFICSAFATLILFSSWFLQPAPSIEDISRDVLSAYEMDAKERQRTLMMANAVLQQRPELLHRPAEWRRVITGIALTTKGTLP